MEAAQSVMVKLHTETPFWSRAPYKSGDFSVPFCQPMDYRVQEILQTRIPEWVAFPFSRGSSQPRDQTQVSYVAGRFFTS